MLRTPSVLEIADFSGGLNTKAGPLKLADNESPSCLNVVTNIYKDLTRRDGQTVLNSTALSETQGNGLFDFALDSVSHRLIGAWGTKIYSMSSLNGTWNQIKTGMTSSVYQFDEFVDNTGTAHLIACNEAHDTPQTWDGVAGSTSDISAMPHGTSPHVYKSYTFVTGMLSTPSRLQFSALADYTTWPATNYYDEVTSDGDLGVGWGELKGILYWFKRHSIFRISYTGGTPLFNRKQVTNVGAIAPRTIANCTIPGTGEVMVFLAPNAGLYAFDGSDAIPISIKIETDNGIAPVSLGTIIKDVSIMKNAWAVNYEDKHWYVLFFTNRDSTTNTNNCGIIWDYYSNSFWPFNNVSYLSGCLMTNNSGQKILLGAGYDGVAKQLFNGNNDNMANINSYYFTKKFDTQSYSSFKKGFELWATCKTLGNYNLGVAYRTNWSTSWIDSEGILENNGEYFLGTTFVLGTATLGGSEGVTRVFNLGRLGNLFQAKIADNSQNPPWTLYRMDIPQVGLGIST